MIGHYSDGTPSLNIEVITREPRQLKDRVQDKTIKMFGSKVCLNCRKPIHDHWILERHDPDLVGSYWCYRDGTARSPGLTSDPLRGD